MSRVPSLSSPFLLGFDEIERALDRVAKAADGYPPYNIERMPRENGRPEWLRITLAVVGFTRDELDVTVEESQLVIRGRQNDEQTRQYLHRGIAARQFQRTFVLADGMEVLLALVVLLPPANNELALLDRNHQLVAGEPGNGKRDPQPLRILRVAREPFDIVGRVTVRGFGDAIERTLDLIEAEQKRA